ncbi:MAG: DNA polymerase III subunit gamma/tau [Eubacterium sp.]|nr:DNA polymerase III subunit gamma/tau [Eubacterium sp.]
MYQVLYRKYRPKSFSDVYGQDHVISTLKNEIKEDRISHAYLFTGSRGTGKTTCAKILAKAVNCENSADGEPCNACEVCRGLDGGTIYDVVEIDAASNNGVDNIRDLREEANYTPTRGRYRVYIIDEVHMLSTGAFNALLKTLEEPPAHVIFILATTEVHKLPATILSRCQRFDFKRIQPETMAVRLKEVASLEGMTLADDAATLIARIADGALRDGLSILDQCSSRNKNIDSQLVSQVAGLAGREVLHKLTNCVNNKNSSAAMEIIAELYQNSYDMERLCVEMINHFRNFLIVKTVKKSRELIVCTDDEYNSILEGAKQFTLENIILGLDLFQNTLTKIKAGANSRIEMEMSFIKLCEPKLDSSNEAVLERLSQVERAVRNGAAVQIASPVSATASSAAQMKNEQEIRNTQDNVSSPAFNTASDDTPFKRTEPEKEEKRQDSPAPKAADPIPQPEPPFVPDEPAQQTAPIAQPVQQGVSEFEHWAEFLDIIHKTDIALFGVLSGAGAHLDSGRFVIDSTNPTIKQFIQIPTHLKAIKQAVLEVTGQPYKIAVSKPKSQQQQKRDLLEDLINRAQNNVEINFE